MTTARPAVTLPIRNLSQLQTALPARFAQFLGFPHPLAWTAHEMAEFDRLQTQLRRAGVTCEVKYGVRDEAGPWCVIWMSGSHVESAYFSRHAGRYVADWTDLKGAIEVGRLGQLVERLMDAVLQGSTH
jgi:hypothetical protein